MNGDGGDPRIVTAQFATVYLSSVLQIDVSETLIRQWASRGKIGRHGSTWTGRPDHRRTLYDLREIVAYANERRQPRRAETEM